MSKIYIYSILSLFTVYSRAEVVNKASQDTCFEKLTDIRYSDVNFKFKMKYNSKENKYFLFTEKNICKFEVPRNYYGKEKQELPVKITEGVIYFTGISKDGKLYNFDKVSNADNNIENIIATCQLRSNENFKLILENEIQLVLSIYEKYNTYIKEARDKALNDADYKNRMIRIKDWKVGQIENLNACKNQGSDSFNTAIEKVLSKFSINNPSSEVSTPHTQRPATKNTNSGSAN